MERIRLDFDFHLTLVSLSGNQAFTDIQEQLTKKGRLIQIQRYSENGATFCNLAGHLDILQALNNRNTAACVKAMQDHLRFVLCVSGHGFAAMECCRNESEYNGSL